MLAKYTADRPDEGGANGRWMKFVASASSISGFSGPPNCPAAMSAVGDRPRLMGSPSLLLVRRADRNLDSKNTESDPGFLHGLNKEGMTIVVVTHDENVARRGSRRVNMKDGRLFGGSETHCRLHPGGDCRFGDHDA